VNAHLKISRSDATLIKTNLIAIPSFGSFTARSLASGDAKNLSRQTNRTFDFELLVLGTSHELITN
jgi:hypothetical protein